MLQFIKKRCDNDMSLTDVFYPDSKVNTQLQSLIDQIVSLEGTVTGNFVDSEGLNQLSEKESSDNSAEVPEYQ